MLNSGRERPSAYVYKPYLHDQMSDYLSSYFVLLPSESNLQLLFTIVENSPSETVRSNCTIALGDLAVRFPNLLEPWTENMYARLRDPSVSVRNSSVLVLSHLILNDMMKVQGVFLNSTCSFFCVHLMSSIALDYQMSRLKVI